MTVSEGELCIAGHPCSGLRAYMALWAAPDKHAGIEELKLNQVHGGADLEALRGCVDLKRLDLGVTHLRENAESGGIPLAVLADFVKLEELSLAGADGLGELSPLIPLGALRHLDTGSTDVKPKPKKTVLDTREEVAAYQKTLARVLKRKDGRTPAEEAWLTGVNTEVKRSTLPADSRKAMAQLRKLLKASDWDSVKQAVELATALGMPEIMATLSEGVSLDADGRLVVGTNSEIHKRVKATMRMPAAFLVACASGLLEGVTVLDLGMEREDRAFLTDLSPVAGHTSILHLKIQLFPITDLSPLETLVNLEVLDIMDCSHLEDVTPLSKLTRLRRLKMDGCSGLTDLSPLAGCASLHEGIEVQGGRLRDTSIEPKQDGGEHPEITGWSVVPVLYSRHPDLGKVTHLNLNRADNLVDLKALEGMGALEELEARCDNLSDLTGLSHCPKLSLLDLRPKNDWRFDGVPLSGL
ncbi:MAG: hypothetical protein VX938_06010, partial [Myxococcota bacterium]|nr:hypothetical protein [Myxococcota bacterium]